MAMQSCGILQSCPQRNHPSSFILLPHQMSYNADNTVAAEAKDGEGVAIIAAVDHEVLVYALDDPGNLSKVSAGFLTPTILSILLSLIVVSAVMLVIVREGTL